MKRLLQWIRNFSRRCLIDIASERDLRQFEKFERALKEGDVEAYVYEEHGLKGQVVLLKGEDLHAVNASNLVSFRKLNRRDSRWLRNKYRKQLSNGLPASNVYNPPVGQND